MAPAMKRRFFSWKVSVFLLLIFPIILAAPLPGADGTDLPNRISYGTLCTVNVSEYEQGYAAGQIARSILLEGRSPASYFMKPTVKGVPMINLLRAKKLMIPIKSGILLSVTVRDEINKDF